MHSMPEQLQTRQITVPASTTVVLYQVSRLQKCSLENSTMKIAIYRVTENHRTNYVKSN